MTRDNRRVLRARPFEIFLLPELPQARLLADAKFRPAASHFRRLRCSVEDRHRRCAAGQRSYPDFVIAGLPDRLTLFSIFILIHSDHFAIGQDTEDRRTHASQIVPGQERRSKHRPEAYVSLVLVSVIPPLPISSMSGSFQ